MKSISKRIKKAYPGIAVFLIMMMLYGCANPFAQAEPENTSKVEEQVTSRPEDHVISLADSMDEQAIIVSVNTIESRMQFYNLDVGRTYSLSYNGLTNVKNRFGEALVAGQLKEGDIARVTFMKDSRLVKSVTLLESEELSLLTEDAPLNLVAFTGVIDEEQYKVNENIPFLSDGKIITYEELNPIDRIKLNIIDKEIKSVTVEKGHGYVRLQGHEPFIDGWVEVGNVIAPVEAEMLMSVPEGNYELYISKDNVQGTEKVAVNRDKETLVDLSKLDTEQIQKTGKVFFTISPGSAKLYIDGEEKDYSEEIELTYGIHQMIARAPGYKGLTQYFKVGQDMANLNVELTKGEDDDEEEEIISANTAKTATSPSEHRVYIDSPSGSELYLNGSSVGIIPPSFAKKEGALVISIRQEGRQPRSYTLQIDDSDKDMTYSFSELPESTASIYE